MGSGSGHFGISLAPGPCTRRPGSARLASRGRLDRRLGGRNGPGVAYAPSGAPLFANLPSALSAVRGIPPIGRARVLCAQRRRRPGGSWEGIGSGGKAARPPSRRSFGLPPDPGCSAGDRGIARQDHRFGAGLSALVPVGPRKSLIFRCVSVCT